VKKLFILDMDGTLYDLADVSAANFEVQIDFLSEKTGMARSDAVRYFAEHDIYPVVRNQSKSATELFAREGFSLSEWNKFRKMRFPIENIKLDKAASPETIGRLSRLGPCVLLSSNSLSTIKAVLGKLSMPVDAFSAIVCSDQYSRATPFRKIDAMSDLLDRFSVAPECMTSIGDRFSTDVAPALELGGSGFIVNRPSGLDAVVNDIENDSPATCQDYTYYPHKATAEHR